MSDTDLEIRGGARSSRPLDTGRRGRGRSPNIFFGPFGPQFGKKYEGGAPGAPSPGSATADGLFVSQTVIHRMIYPVESAIQLSSTLNHLDKESNRTRCFASRKNCHLYYVH